MDNQDDNAKARFIERIGVGFNPNISLEEAAQYAQLSEQHGYNSFWVHENPFIKDAVGLAAGSSSPIARKTSISRTRSLLST